MRLEILTFPNPLLREVAHPVSEFGAEIQQLASDMLETMLAASGIGLAAPQVGVLKRLLVLDTRPKEDKAGRYKAEEMTDLEKAVEQPLVLINPVILRGEGKTTFDEGCLSIPGYFETVERYRYIEVKAQDTQGREFIVKADGLLAICIQHEMDHLEGTLFIDHLNFLKSQKIKNQIKKHGYLSKSKEKVEV